MPWVACPPGWRMWCRSSQFRNTGFPFSPSETISIFFTASRSAPLTASAGALFGGFGFGPWGRMKALSGWRHVTRMTIPPTTWCLHHERESGQWAVGTGEHGAGVRKGGARATRPAASVDRCTPHGGRTNASNAMQCKCNAMEWNANNKTKTKQNNARVCEVCPVRDNNEREETTEKHGSEADDVEDDVRDEPPWSAAAARAALEGQALNNPERKEKTPRE